MYFQHSTVTEKILINWWIILLLGIQTNKTTKIDGGISSLLEDIIYSCKKKKKPFKSSEIIWMLMMFSVSDMHI